MKHLFILALLLTSCASPVSAMSSPLMRPMVIQTRAPLVRPVAYLPLASMGQFNAALGVECDSYLMVGNLWCPAEYVLPSPAKWLRAPMAFWRDEEAVQGVYNFTVDDAPRVITGFINAIQHGITPILVIRTVPDWASTNPGVPCGPIAPQYYAAFGNYVNAVIDAYHVTYVEIWNEPDAQINDGWGYIGCWPTGTSYVDMLKVAYPIIKAVHPQVHVIAGAIMLDPSSQWMQQAIAAGIGKYSDIVSYHAYQWYPNTGDVTRARVNELKVMLPGKPLMMSEGGMAAGTETITLQIRNTQATYLTQMMNDCKVDGEVACIWFRTSPVAYFHTEMVDANGSPNAIYSAFVGVR